jgi:hypothetical protein
MSVILLAGRGVATPVSLAVGRLRGA